MHKRNILRDLWSFKNLKKLIYFSLVNYLGFMTLFPIVERTIGKPFKIMLLIAV